MTTEWEPIKTEETDLKATNETSRNKKLSNENKNNLVGKLSSILDTD